MEESANSLMGSGDPRQTQLGFLNLHTGASINEAQDI